MSHMETPLLHGAPEAEDRSLLAENGDYAPVKGWLEWRKVVWIETVKMWKIAAPIAFNIICQFAVNSITTMFVGHIGDLELSAVSISLSVIGTFSFGFMLGMGSALETLCGQAFGAGRVDLLGVYMQRSIIILSVTCLVILPIYIFASPILILLGQQENIADMAGHYTLLMIPQLFSLAITFPTSKFLQAQSKVNVVAWIGFVALIIHVVLLWLFIYPFNWGVEGAAFAFDLTNWGIALAQLIYVICWCKEGWKGFSWMAFQEIWPFVRLSLSSAVMLCLEVWYAMSIVVLVGHFDNAVVAVDSLSVCANISGLEGMLFIGINAAISVRVSNELGFGHPRASKYAVYVTVIQSFLIGILLMVAVMMLRYNIAFLFTNSKAVQEVVSRLAYLLSLNMLLNSVQPVISGVAVGAGWQTLVAYVNVGCYYIVGLPLGFLLGYKANLGIQGVWGGMLVGIFLQTLILLLVLYRTNWNTEVAQTTERLVKWGGQDLREDRNPNP